MVNALPQRPEALKEKLIFLIDAQTEMFEEIVVSCLTGGAKPGQSVTQSRRQPQGRVSFAHGCRYTALRCGLLIGATIKWMVAGWGWGGMRWGSGEDCAQRACGTLLHTCILAPPPV